MHANRHRSGMLDSKTYRYYTNKENIHPEHEYNMDYIRGFPPQQRPHRQKPTFPRYPSGYDRLVLKDGRTLHDLSCQFGTKGFSKEMRQVAGGSQSGLRKFLSQYPALFTLNGDLVTITCYNGSGVSSNSPGKYGTGRDYAQEAAEYFADKLEQYGPAEVPIKSLLGHRSQAPPEVRHVSGQHMREFKDFLLKFPEHFVLRGDLVVLRRNLELVGEDALMREDAADDFYSDEEEEPEPLDPLVMAQLLDFCQSLIESRGSTTVDHLFGQLSMRMPRESWSKLVHGPQDLNTFLKMHSDTFLVQSNMVSLLATKPNRAPLNSYQPQPSVPSPNEPVRTSPNWAPASKNTPLPVANQTISQRVKSHLMKAVADNAAMDKAMEQRSVGTFPSSPSSLGSYGTATDHSMETAEISHARLMQSIKVINTVKECAAMVTAILDADPPCAVSLDAEGVNLGPNGPMALLQVGTFQGQIFVLDLIACPAVVAEGRIKELLESPTIVKVMHDCRNDSGALFYQFGITLQNVFDTQAAHAIIQQQQTGKPVHKVKNVSLNTLCRIYGGPITPKREQLKKLYRRDQKYWSRRPLTEDMILYAAYDVWALVPTVYEAMTSLLDENCCRLLQELCREQVETYINLEDVKMSKKHRKVEAEVGELKRKLAAVKGKTVVLSNREIRLLRYVELTDQEREKLEGSYKVAKKLERLHGRNVDGMFPVNSAPGSETSGQDGSGDMNGDDEDYDEEDEDDYDNELDGCGSSSGKSTPDSPYRDGFQPSTPTDSGYHLVEKFLANGRFDGKTVNAGSSCCSCRCRGGSDSMVAGARGDRVMVDASCQTLSTGDIVITKVFFEDRDKNSK